MKKTISILFIVILILPVFASAQDSGVGLGVILGDPSGVSFKGWTGSYSAVDIAIAWSFEHEDAFHVHLDYLLHSFNLFNIEKGDLVLFYGVGGRLKAEEKSRVGVRIPVGLTYLFENDPLELFFELGPILDLAPRTDFRMTGGLGIRYYF
jgi:hypothetical protein